MSAFSILALTSGLVLLQHNPFLFLQRNRNLAQHSMKFAVATLLIAPALAFAPTGSFAGVRRSALDAVATSEVRLAVTH
jgi:hypothetical protein